MSTPPTQGPFDTKADTCSVKRRVSATSTLERLVMLGQKSSGKFDGRGFVIVAALDLGAHPVVVAISAIAATVAGHLLVTQHKHRSAPLMSLTH